MRDHFVRAMGIIVGTAAEAGLRHLDLVGPSRKAAVCRARALAMERVAKDLGWGSRRIGHLFRRRPESVWRARRTLQAPPTPAPPAEGGV